MVNYYFCLKIGNYGIDLITVYAGAPMLVCECGGLFTLDIEKLVIFRLCIRY